MSKPQSIGTNRKNEGSKGENSSSFSGLRVETKDGFRVTYFFTSKNGINYYQRGISVEPEQTPNNISKLEFRKRLVENGASVKEISLKEKKKMEKEYEKERKITEQQLIQHDLQDKTMKYGTRMNRIMNRRRWR